LPPNSDFVTGRPAIQAVWQSVMDVGIKDVKLQTVELEGHGETAIEVRK
jgi:ketosteroid isomerase-like protein